MNKAWLEDKKKQLNNATIFINENGNEAVEVSLTVLNKLFEQAELTDASILQNTKLAIEFERLQLENKRYREAIDKTLHKCDLADDTGHDYTDEIRYELRKALEESE